ncbi:hypothetical protein H5410_000943, partial [Solanum commersonii]
VVVFTNGWRLDIQREWVNHRAGTLVTTVRPTPASILAECGTGSFHGNTYIHSGKPIPICASIWTCPLAGVLGFSVYQILPFCHDHNLLQLFGLPQLLTVTWRLHINKLQTTCDSTVNERTIAGCTVAFNDGAKEVFDGCIMDADAPSTLEMLGKEATCDKTRILGAF